MPPRAIFELRWLDDACPQDVHHIRGGQLVLRHLLPGYNAPDMPVPPLAAATFAIETEAYQTLLARARRRTGRVPPELIARHVLSVTR